MPTPPRLPAARRRDVLLAGAACLLGAAAVAQAPPIAQPTATPPPIAAWRAPTLQVAGAEQPVRLASLQVDVEVAGGAAETRVQMVFFNPNSRVLEGKLQFPLAPGQVVSGFALDVDGRLRAAVPVEKVRAQQVFEDISRRRVDPGLLQTTIGNNYELRIYPLLPGKTRTVELRIVEPAAGRLQVPLALRRSRRVAGAVAARARGADRARARRRRRAGAALRAGERRRLHRPRRRSATSCCRRRRWRCACRRAAAPRRSPPRSAATAAATSRSSCPSCSGRRRARCRIACRSSGMRRGRARIARSTASSRCSTPTSRPRATPASAWFASPTRRRRRCASRSAAATGRALRKSLESTVYDGASNLGAVRHDGVSAEALWFSDGLANYGAPWRLAFPVPVYAISSAASGDPAALLALADASGGRSIDLATATRQGAADALLRRGTDVAAVSAVGAGELVVQSQSAASGRLVVAGVMSAADAEVTVRLRDASGAHDDAGGDGSRRPQSVAPRRRPVGAADARVARRRGANEQGPHPRARQALRPGDARDVADRPRAGRRLRAPRDRAAGRAARRLRPGRRGRGQAPRRRRSGAGGPGREPVRGARRVVEPRLPEGRPAGAAAGRQVAAVGERVGRAGRAARDAAPAQQRRSRRRQGSRARRGASADGGGRADAVRIRGRRQQRFARPGQEGRGQRRAARRRRSRSRSRRRRTRAKRSSGCRRRGPRTGSASTSTSAAPTR